MCPIPHSHNEVTGLEDLSKASSRGTSQARLQPYEIAEPADYRRDAIDRWGLEPHLVLIQMSKHN